MTAIITMIFRYLADRGRRLYAARQYIAIAPLAMNLKRVFRTLIRQRGFTTVVILTLALGIGATIAIFSVVNAVLLRDLPYPNADRLLALRTTTIDGSSTGGVAPRDMPTLYGSHPSLDAAAIAFYTGVDVNYVGLGTNAAPSITG